jgi:hypothetical protein
MTPGCVLLFLVRLNNLCTGCIHLQHLLEPMILQLLLMVFQEVPQQTYTVCCCDWFECAICEALQEVAVVTP